MTEEANKLIVALREDAEWAHANEWETPITLGDHLDEAADLIESLYSQLEQVTNERDGLNIMLAQAQAMLETRTRERDAAVEDVKSLCATNYYSGNFCAYCKYNEPDGQCHHHCIPYSSEWGWQWRGVEVEG